MINVHSYESMGTFDGPGLRLVVFLQGCPFRCLYCANPDTIDVKGGTPTTPEEILQMAISQKAFFGKKGGITFSGGEPTLQAEALIPLFKELKANGIHICLDSNGGIWNEKVEELFSLTDLVLLDIKDTDSDGGTWLMGNRIKTGVAYVVKLLPIAIELIEKYRGTDEKKDSPNVSFR